MSLLITDLDFPVFKTQIEADHLLIGFDNLEGLLKKRRLVGGMVVAPLRS